MPTKVCSKCGIEKGVSEFYKDNRRKSGLKSCCKKCSLFYTSGRTNYYKKRYEARKIIRIRGGTEICCKCKKEKNVNQFTLGGSLCKDCTKQYKKEYYLLNKKKVSTKNTDWYKKNKNKHREICRNWEKNNLEKCRKRSKTKAAKYRENLSPVYIKEKLKRDGFPKDFIESAHDLIEAKRELIKLKRLYKSKKHEK